MLEALAAEQFDVLVIGGGITGAGVALDAATRGLRTALVERDDFASGTSSKSSKMIHGGLRYLQQGDVRLVYQALRERQRLLRNAPHLVTVLPFLIPVLTKDGPVSKKIAKALRSALWMYDLTGGLRIGKRHQRLNAQQSLAHCPTMPADKLSSGFVYFDAGADDARVTLAVARTAAAHGAVAANRCEVVELTKDATGRADGAVVDTGAGRVRVRAHAVVSATGVWADTIRELDEGIDPDSIRPAKGVHITVPWHLVRNDIAVILSVPGDKRSMFLVPWGQLSDGTFEHCYIGTTDTDFVGDLDDPHTNDDDLDYLLQALQANLTSTITRADVTGVWAGLRPLVKQAASGRTADLSRRHSVTTGESGMITVTGGKFTTYRAMAQDTVDLVLDRLGRSGRCRTRKLRLNGGEDFAPVAADHPDARLAGRYGTETAEIKALIALDASLAEPMVPGLRYLRAEAVYAVRSEMATGLTDVLTRRTRAHLEDRAACLLSGCRSRPTAGPRVRVDRRTSCATGQRLPRPVRRRTRLRWAARPPTCEGSSMTSPLAPIELNGTDDHLSGVPAALPDGFVEQLATLCDTITDVADTAEASRDWWPLTLHWALAGRGAAASRRHRSSLLDRPGFVGVGVLQRGRRPGHAGSGSQRRVRRIGARVRRRVARSDGARFDRRGRRHLGHRRSRCRGVRTRSRACHQRASRAHRRSLPAELRHRNRRRLGGVPRGRPVLHPLRQDRGHGRRSRGGARRWSRSSARVARLRPLSDPTSIRCSSVRRARSA